MQDKEQKRKEKVIKAIKEGKIKDDTTFSVFQIVEDLNDRLDDELPTLKNIYEKIKGDKGDAGNVFDELTPEQKLEIKGDKGDLPNKEDLIKVIAPLIPKPIKGDSYVLTDADKRQIALSIEVPIVKHVIKTIETPIVTKNILEKAMYESSEQIINKINKSNNLIDNTKIKGFSDLEKLFKLNSFNPTMGPSFSDLANINRRIDSLSSGGGTVGPGTINEIAYFDSTTTIKSLTVVTYPSLTELSYVKGVTSAIQTQLNGKQTTLTPAALTKVNDTNVTLTLGGTPATALLQATSLTLGWTGTLANTRGGTGLDTSGSTGIAQILSGTWSVSTALVNGTTATTQSAGDNTTKIATDAFVTTAINNAIAGVNPAVAVQAATTQASDTSGLTYNNGVSGIGATLTGANNTALTIDGYTFTALGQRLLVKNDTQSPSGAFNGVYYVTQVQAALLPLILTRALDYDMPSDINNTGAIPVVNGTVNALTSWLLTSQVTTMGTDPLTYSQFSYSPTRVIPPNLGGTGVANNSASTITLASAKTLTINNSLTFAGTDSTTMTFPSTSATIARTDAANTFIGASTATSWILTTPTIQQINSTSNNPIKLNAGTITPLQSYSPTAAGTATLDLSLGNVHAVAFPAGNITLAITHDTAPQIFTVELKQDSGGSRTVTWFSGISWAGGTPPTLTTTANKTDIFTFRVVTAGSVYYGMVSGQNI